MCNDIVIINLRYNVKCKNFIKSEIMDVEKHDWEEVWKAFFLQKEGKQAKREDEYLWMSWIFAWFFIFLPEARNCELYQTHAKYINTDLYIFYFYLYRWPLENWFWNSIQIGLLSKTFWLFEFS